MTYQQAGVVAVVKRIIGWVVFIPAVLSTLISLLNFCYMQGRASEGVSAVMLDFMHVMIDMIRFNTNFLNVFWNNSPVPQLDAGFSSTNILFLVIYFLIFVGLALQASGARMARQVKNVREGLEDQLILEKIGEMRSRAELEEKIVIPHHTIFAQYFTLYILPIIIGVIAYYLLKLAALAG